LRARPRGGSLEIGKTAGLGAVGVVVHLYLLIAGKAELVGPRIEEHYVGCESVEGFCWENEVVLDDPISLLVVGTDVCRPKES